MKLFGLEFDSFRDRPNWYVATKKPVSPREYLKHLTKIQDIAKEHSVEAASEGYQLFCGLIDDNQKQHALFAIKDIDACELVKEFRVGSHNQHYIDWEQSTPKIVYGALCQIRDQVRAFRPYFVDSAGYHAAFKGRLTPDEAERFVPLINVTYDVGNEWQFECWQHNDFSDTGIAATVLEENAFHLWWD